MKTKINLTENDAESELGWDEFWPERNRLEAKGWQLVMSFPDTKAGKRDFAACTRSQEKQNFKTKVLRRPGFMVVLNKKPDQTIPETTANTEEAICEGTRPDMHKVFDNRANLRSVA